MAAFWELLMAERDAVTTVPPERFDMDQWYDPVPGTPHRIVSRSGGILDDIDTFDAAFFNISPRVATRLDPQQRLLLEVAWDAVEDAGLPMPRLAGSNTGVYTTCLASGYWNLLRNAGVYDLHASMGSEPGGIGAGLISYHLDLRGPSMGLEASCASSLLAVHVACRALKSGEIDQAIVGGSNLLVSPDIHFALSEAEMLSPTGRCRFGDTGADGLVRSEGVVAMVLKPLSRALEDGDRIHATILGTGATNDGRSGGTMICPGVEGQAAMLRTAYRDAGVSPADIDYVQVHGAGTPNGDRAELTALSQVLREGRPPDRRCLIGSSKSYVGHTEFVSGLVGLLKAVLAVQHRIIPATLHIREQNPILNLPDSPVELAVRTRQWPDVNRPAIAGVSSFGLSGTNTHVVLTEAVPEHPVPPVHRGKEPPAYVLPISAHDPKALMSMARRYADTLSTQVASMDMRNVCYSAGARRTHHRHRLTVVGPDRQAVVEKLRAYVSRADTGEAARHRATPENRPQVVFVFSGTGSQWPGMGRELLRDNPVFLERMRECEAAIRAECGWSIIDRLRSDRPLTDLPEMQPALWAMQVSLSAVWQDWGMRPDLVIGHSMGEIAAATATGALTVQDGASVVCRRSMLLAELPGQGSMWAVQLGERDAQEAIGELADRVCVGVINSAHSTVLSGDPDALERVLRPLAAKGVFCRQVPVDYASHGPHVEPLRSRLVDSLTHLRPRAGQTMLHSTVLDRVVDGAKFDAAYWAENLRRPVRFASAVRSVLTKHTNVLFIEVSPHPILGSAIEEAIQASATKATVIATLHRNQPETASMLAGLGGAYVRGYEPDWARVYDGGRFVPLPAYAWQRKRFWIERPASGPVASSPDPAHEDHGPVVLTATTAVAAQHDPAEQQAEPVSVAVMTEPAEPVLAPTTVEVPQPEIAAPQESRSVADLTRYLVALSAEVLAMPPDEIDPDLPLSMVGLDSLLAARLRASVHENLNIAVDGLMGGRTVSQLARELADMVRDTDVDLTAATEA